MQLTELSFSLPKGSLSLCGYKFDHVRAHLLIDENPDDDLDDYEKEPEILPLLRQALTAERFWRDCSVDRSPYGDHDAQYRARWRTVIADGNQYRKRPVGEYGLYIVPPSEAGEVYENIMQRADFSKSPEYDLSDLNLYPVDYLRDWFLDVVSGRNVLLTSKGCYGIGPWGTNRDDIVVVVPGFKMPVILRKRPLGESYQLVGVAYIHGIMRGEFMERVSENSGFVLNTYVID